jgi:hypothetical protein
MFERASIFNALVGIAVDVVRLSMALLSLLDSTPRAYRLKVSNAAPLFFQHPPGHRRPAQRALAQDQHFPRNIAKANL